MTLSIELLVITKSRAKGRSIRCLGFTCRLSTASSPNFCMQLLRPSVVTKLLRGSRRLLLVAPSRSFTSATFQEGDIVLLRPKLDQNAKPVLSKPLKPRGTEDTHRGILKHSDILGTRVRDVVTSSSNVGFRVYEPTLAEYTSITPRIVTPIYPGDASLIVSILDLHISPYDPNAPPTPPLEILEAGTGHGSLTLQLARAIHCANSPPPPPPQFADQYGRRSPKPAASVSDENSTEKLADTYEEWKRTRRAIIHTVDVSARHSSFAQHSVINNYRRGFYYGDIDFHVADVSTWIAEQTAIRKASLLAQKKSQEEEGSEEPSSSAETHLPRFLSHAILDLPSSDDHFAALAPALQLNGVMIVFSPSITQIMQCFKRIGDEKLPFLLERVIELESNSSEGRLWDLRAVKVRAREREKLEKAAKRQRSETADEDAGEGEPDLGMGEREAEQMDASAVKEDDFVMVCRPKVGERIVGGGFLGVWRRMRQEDE
ncbi:MAG: hypothetical protein M1820_006581 [Bogoriella megaspora]|nr:MAG: hypothetical protein M1820_006581 [Bogoriella megaspora]